jgi:hypothetical protein
MTRRHVSDTDTRWVMVCDVPRCRTWSEPFSRPPALEIFQDRGWFVAKRYGDVCPACLSSGHKPTADPYQVVSTGQALRKGLRR